MFQSTKYMYIPLSVLAVAEIEIQDSIGNWTAFSQFCACRQSIDLGGRRELCSKRFPNSGKIKGSWDKFSAFKHAFYIYGLKNTRMTVSFQAATITFKEQTNELIISKYDMPYLPLIVN